MDQKQLAEVYEMVDNIPFSRQKKNIGRDFSDALMMAQLIHHYFPKKVQLHNYTSTNTINKKIQNWNTLNNKVLKKLGISLTIKEIQQIVNIKPMAIEKILYRFLLKFERPEQQRKISNQFNRMEIEQNMQSSNIGKSNQLSLMNKKGQAVNLKKQKQDTEQVLDLIDKIDYAYAQLLKLQEMSRLKDDMIKNLEKKVEKVIFN